MPEPQPATIWRSSRPRTCFVAHYDRIRSSTAAALAAAQHDGYIRADVDAEAAALRLTAMMDGLQTQWLFDRSIDLAEQISETVFDWMTENGRKKITAVAG